MSKDVSKQPDQSAALRARREELCKSAEKINELKTRYEKELEEAKNPIVQAFVLGCAVIDLRLVVREFLPVLKELRGTPLGFKTDKDGDPPEKQYGDQVIVECAIEAAIRGARWTNNEFNIIFGGAFLTKAYWWRKLLEVPGLSEPVFIPGVPAFENQKCYVPVTATWVLNGRPGKLERKVVIRAGKSDDATVGKAEARMYRAVYQIVTNTEGELPEDPAAVLTEGPKTAPAVADRVKCDGDHGAPRCGAAPGQCWQDDPPPPREADMSEWERQQQNPAPVRG